MRAGIDLTAGQWIAVAVVQVLGAAMFFVLGLACRPTAQLPDDLAEPTHPPQHLTSLDDERYSWMSERRSGPQWHDDGPRDRRRP